MYVSIVVGFDAPMRFDITIYICTRVFFCLFFVFVLFSFAFFFFFFFLMLLVYLPPRGVLLAFVAKMTGDAERSSLQFSRSVLSDSATP